MLLAPVHLGASLLQFKKFNCQFVRYTKAITHSMKVSKTPLPLSVEAVIAASPDAVVVHDLENVVLQWNPVAEDLYGWGQDEIVGEKITEVFYLDGAIRAVALEQLLKTGSWEGELEQIDASGSGHCLMVRQTLLRDDAGEPVAIISFNSVRRLVPNRESSTDPLKDHSDSQTPLAHFAHEMNNILAPIMLSSAILERRIEDQKSKNMAILIETCARKGSQLVAEMAADERAQD